jgi:predicted FMN-binding regulatory protein PaiB
MYCPSHFQEDRPEIIRDLIVQFPLATIVYQRGNQLNAEHIPLILDPSLRAPDRLLQIVTAMTDQMEATQDQPWKVTDAPSDYIERMIAAIVGIELEVVRWQGKWKVSQNQPASNQNSLANQLVSDGADRAKEMANLISRFGSA